MKIWHLKYGRWSGGNNPWINIFNIWSCSPKYIDLGSWDRSFHLEWWYWLFLSEMRNIWRSCSTTMALLWYNGCTTPRALNTCSLLNLTQGNLWHHSSYELSMLFALVWCTCILFHFIRNQLSLSWVLFWLKSVWLLETYVGNYVNLSITLSPLNLSFDQSTRVYNVLALLQVCFYIRKQSTHGTGDALKRHLSVHFGIKIYQYYQGYRIC